MNIAIDGPSGAGKSTIAKKVAAQLNMVYVDTGAMYRAIGFYFLNHNIDPSDEKACNEALPEINVRLFYEDGLMHVLLNDEDITGMIRTQKVGEAASKGSKNPKVREHLLLLQRKMAETNPVIMDGRDIGTVVLPNADLKIFLTASSRVRAERRTKELLEKGETVSIDEVQKEIEERDYRDSHREIAPLKQAEDAYLLDSSNLTIDEVVEKIISLIGSVQ